ESRVDTRTCAGIKLGFREGNWSYSALAVVIHAGAEYEMRDGRVVLRNKPVATRGLNANCNRRLKSVFISAATSGGPVGNRTWTISKKGDEGRYGPSDTGAENRGAGFSYLEERHRSILYSPSHDHDTAIALEAQIDLWSALISRPSC